MAEPLRLLIDACLTPAAIPQLAAMFGDAADALHADHVLPRGTADANVFAWATAEQRLLVTANEPDFLVLARGYPSHAGVAFVSDQNTRARQIKAIGRLVRALLARRSHSTAGRIFFMGKSGRLVTRRIP